MRQIVPDSGQEPGTGLPMPAPVGGWNARDSLAAMKPSDAIYLDNWMPGTTEVRVRKGYTQFAVVRPDIFPVTLAIQTLLGVACVDGTQKLFAADQNGIRDITAGGNIMAIATPATTAIWQQLQINVGGTSFLYAVSGDGTNKARIYNATLNTWQILDVASAPIALTGVVSADIINIGLWKYRTIFLCRNSLSFWYGALNSVGGAFSTFPLGAVFKLGGYLVAVYNWTVDAGDGPDDRLVFITSEGEVAVYQGTDPSDADNFSIVGVYNVGRPIGYRCFFTYGGDAAVLTEQGLWPLSKALNSATLDRAQALTDKIVQAFNAYFLNFGTEFGWQPVLYSTETAIVVNVPLGLQRSYQFVMNTMTGAWCRFTNWNANCLLVLKGKFYFASTNVVMQGFVGTKDKNSAITAFAKTAFTYGSSGMRGKQVKLVKPIMTATTSISVGLALDTDYADRRSYSSVTNFIQNISLYDVAIYDQSVWSGANVTINRWRSVNHTPGAAFSLRVRVALRDISCSWSATHFISEKGTVFG